MPCMARFFVCGVAGVHNKHHTRTATGYECEGLLYIFIPLRRAAPLNILRELILQCCNHCNLTPIVAVVSVI